MSYGTYVAVAIVELTENAATNFTRACIMYLSVCTVRI